MGTWGTGISSNDTYADVYSEFFDLYNEGKDAPEITEKILKAHWEILEMPEDVNNLWFALAKAQWECRNLQAEVFDKVKGIIESDSDLDIWKDLGATTKEIEKRRKALQRFLELLQSERPKAKARKKKVVRQPIFSKGDCLTFKLSNGNFGGAVVLEAEYDTEHGLNLVALTRLNKADRPTINDFEKAEILVKNWGAWDDSEELCWIFNYRSKEVLALFEVVGSIAVKEEYLSRDKKHKYSFTSGWRISLIDGANSQFESEKTKPTPKKRLFISEFTKPSGWKFW
jgi:hypothetical protein